MHLPAPFYELHGQIAIDLPGARGVFTTARAGNLGLRTGDPAAPGNRRALAECLGVELAWRHQVHGAVVHHVAEPNDPEATAPDADGVVTDVRRLAVLVLGADCLPIVMSDGRRVVSVHAGWRGLAEGVIARGVTALGPAGPTVAAIGPAAGPCCYAVGDDLRERFAGYDAESAGNLDLKRIARVQLVTAGVRVVHDVGICTICAPPERFFSYRRDGGISGLQAGLGWLTG